MRIYASCPGHDRYIFCGVVKAICCPEQNTLQRASSINELHKGDHCGGRRCDTLLRFFAQMPMGGLLFSVFWIIFMPMFYYQIFLPCWDCYDFRATIAHEWGHVLGFTHPDTMPHLNLRAMTPAEDARATGQPVPLGEPSAPEPAPASSPARAGA